MRFFLFAIATWLVPAVYAQDAPLPPETAAGSLALPEGFQATLFAGEPDVVQPIAFTFDDRGRLWVVECLSYPDWQKTGHDRVVIFEDRDGDGRFDERKVFWDEGSNLAGIEWGFGGVWLCATPNLLFLPDHDGNDVPDGPPQVLLDGWDLKARHNVFNGLTWGPEGWLYGCNGILSNSLLGKPGTPDDERVSFNCGVWRYHPTRHAFEVVAWGTTNPWGLDFDDHGELFITNCVIHHLFHVVPGAHYDRMFGQDLNPNSYGLLPSCADYIHWGGGPWQGSRGGKVEHSASGGGHAHVGAMVYLGDNWPAKYRDSLFTCNLHGSRVNNDRLTRHGSGYKAERAPEFLFAKDPWFRGLELAYGPDGGVYLTDWSDTGECHDYDHIHRTSGRIFKITYGDTKHAVVDLAKRSDRELVELQLHENDWHCRHSRRLLQERAAAGKLSEEAVDQLKTMLDRPELTRRLRALWTLHAVGGADIELLLSLLEDPAEQMRSWAVRLSVEKSDVDSRILRKLAALAAEDASPQVRLAVAGALQRLPVEQRWSIAEGLVGHAEDAADVNLPLMVWYGIEPLVPAAPQRAMKLLDRCEIPLVRQHLARRTVAESMQPLVSLLNSQDDSAVQRDVLAGMSRALEGRRRVPMPGGWQPLYARLGSSVSTEVAEAATRLSLTFGDPQAEAWLRSRVADVKLDAAQRQAALNALVEHKVPALPPLLKSLLDDPALCSAALRGLAVYSDSDTPRAILSRYGKFDAAQRADAVQTLSARPEYALALLSAVESKQVDRNELSTFTVRQLLGMQHPQLQERLRQVWGEFRATPADKVQQIRDYKAKLTPDYLKDADLTHGRAIFRKQCAACHRLFDDGRKVGPDLTGSQRANLDYVLENLLDPNALIGRDYQMTVIQTVDGRVINGLILREDAQSLRLQTQNEEVLVPTSEIDVRQTSPISLMPDGMLTRLLDGEVRDLVAYLASPQQVAFPSGENGDSP